MFFTLVALNSLLTASPAPDAAPAPGREAPPRFGQDGQADSKPEPMLWKIGLDTRYYVETDFDDIDEDIEITRVGVHGSRKFLLDDTSGVKLLLKHEESEYDIGGPFDDFDGSETTVGLNYWSVVPGGPEWFAIFNVVSGTEDDADFDDGIYFKGGAGVTWKLNEDLDLGFGLFGYSRLEDDTKIIPFPLIKWKFGNQSEVGFVPSADPALGYTYHLTEAVDLYAAVQVATRQYRLDDFSNDAAVTDRESSLRGGVLWNNGKGFNAEGFVGVATREFTLDFDDDKVDDEDVDPAPLLGLSVAYSF